MAGEAADIGAAEALPEMPEGINLEEARMLEAAMLGVPYQARHQAQTLLPIL